jgi:hypothetical protein
LYDKQNPVVEPHPLNSVKPTDYSWSFRPILWNDLLGLLWGPG